MGNDDGLQNGEIRDEAGRFAPGTAGGPGRPRGKRSALQQSLDALATSQAEEVLLTLLNAAKAGDVQAARIVLDRAWPSPKGRAVAFDLGKVEGVGDLPVAVGKLLEAVATGELLPDEAQSLAGVAETYRKAVELADIERRVTTLEARRT